MTCPMMMSLGVYLLGAADPAERRRVEAHLPGCPACRAELRRLAPLPGMLAGIPESLRGTARPRRQLAGPAARALPHRGTRLRWAVGAAACLAGAAAAGGFWLSAGGGQGAGAVTLAGTNPATHVSATAVLTATSWGTSIQLEVNGIPENVECLLVVHSRAGRTEVSGVWDAWSKGPVSIPASASWRPSDIASLQVATMTRNLVTISAGQQPARADRRVAP